MAGAFTTVNLGQQQQQSDLAQIERRKQLADALSQQSVQPIQSSMPNVPISFTQGLAKLLEAYQARKEGESAEADRQKYFQEQGARQSADTALLAQALQGKPAQPASIPDNMIGSNDATPAQTPVQALGQAIPMMGPQMQPIALQAMQGEQTRQENREARMEERRLAIDAQTQQRAREESLRRELAGQADTTRRDLAAMQQGNRNPVAVIDPKTNRPILVSPDKAVGMQPYNPKQGGQLSPTALREQNELLSEIGIAGNIRSDLNALDQQLMTGKLDFGPISNKLNAVRNYVGMSNEGSQNYNSAVTTLERLRNDSLRLNKGVQTEGDAQRAWNELMGSLNDPAVVSKRLKEIQSINERAARLKGMQIDTIRANYGLDPMDTTKFTGQAPVVGQPPAGGSGITDFASLQRGRRKTD